MCLEWLWECFPAAIFVLKGNDDMKKIAVMIYPYFSMQEISCLTDGLKVYFDIDVDVFAASKEIIRSEDNFQVIANKTFEEFSLEEYGCLILPGIWNPLPALFDERNIRFLQTLRNSDILLCAISSAPMLLAKAGLLENAKFTSGMFDEICRELEFIPYANIVRKPLVKDKNVITAVGFAFREFAEEVVRTLNIDPLEQGLFRDIERTWTEEDFVFRMGEENFSEFLREYEQMTQQ